MGQVSRFPGTGEKRPVEVVAGDSLGPGAISLISGESPTLETHRVFEEKSGRGRRRPALHYFSENNEIGP